MAPPHKERHHRGNQSATPDLLSAWRRTVMRRACRGRSVPRGLSGGGLATEL